MSAHVTALRRHPVKGFTPEALDEIVLEPGGHVPCDRIYAVEDGPSGFDPAAPAHISKMKFAVLAKIPELARVRTLYDEDTGFLSVTAGGHPPFHGRLTIPQGRAAFAAWLGEFLEEQAPDDSFGPLTVLAAPPGYRFTDSKKGFVSVLNLDSLREMEARIGRPIDPARFRANVLVEGWGAWREYGLGEGLGLRLGGVELRLLKDIDRCLATHVDPRTGARDIDMVPSLHAEYGHICCGVYAEVVEGGRIAVGDEAVLSS